jgi:hypothetical protein
LLDDVVGSFLDSVGEREFDAPLMALLRSHGFTDIHFVHGQYEFGKDVIAKSEDGAPVQYVLQSKAGDLGLSQWTGIRGQIDLLRTNELSHPSFDRTLPRRAVLVITGRLIREHRSRSRITAARAPSAGKRRSKSGIGSV